MLRDRAQGPVVTSGQRLLGPVHRRVWSELQPVGGEGTVGVLGGETCNFAWEPSKMGS